MALIAQHTAIRKDYISCKTNALATDDGMNSTFGQPEATPTILGRPINHICYSVDDLEQAAAFWASVFGAGPFFKIEATPFERSEHRGQPALWNPVLAFGQWGPIGVELLEVANVEPATLASHFSARGSVNHIAFLAADPQAESARLEALGLPLLLTNRRGNAETTWHAAPELGHSIEIHRDIAPIRSFFNRIAAAADGWDGSDLMRSLG